MYLVKLFFLVVTLCNNVTFLVKCLRKSRTEPVPLGKGPSCYEGVRQSGAQAEVGAGPKSVPLIVAGVLGHEVPAVLWGVMLSVLWLSCS